jgi:L-asparaginase II
MDPVLVEATRGGLVESRHRGAAIVVDAQGASVLALGDTEQAVFPRSAVKALLALPLVETGAADRLGLTAAELALACASHSGEPAHVALVETMLGRVGRGAEVLECGAHWPYRDAAMRAMVAAGQTPTALHNNCSGKHAGFVCLACDQGHDPAGYVAPDHPTMRMVTAALSEMTDTVLDERNRGIDGCSIPTFAIPLRALALAFARFATGQGMHPDRAAAAARIRAAVAESPFMVAGTDRFDTKLMTATGATVFSKTGAEGVFCVALPTLGLGLALKCDDGGGRASEAATASILRRLLPQFSETLAPLATPALHNWNGIAVGGIRPAEALA